MNIARGLSATSALVAASTFFALPAFGQAYDTELVVNGSGEAGPASSNGMTVVPAPGWTSFGGFTVVAYGASGFPVTGPGRGSKFFAGGPDALFSTASQDISLQAIAGDVDSGGVGYDLGAWLGGYGSQDDSASVTLLFNDSQGQSLGTAGIQGPFATERQFSTKLVWLVDSGFVPVGTRSITIVISMARTTGTYNDGYADGVSLRLSAPVCDPDYDQSGVGDQSDVDYLINVVSGGDNPTGRDPDFNRDGNPDQGDVDALVNVIAGGVCP